MFFNCESPPHGAVRFLQPFYIPFSPDLLIMSGMKRWALVLAVAALYFLHQDIWNWTDRRLVFGVIPVGLFYHGCFSAAASLLMWALVKFAWPAELEREIEGRASSREVETN